MVYNITTKLTMDVSQSINNPQTFKVPIESRIEFTATNKLPYFGIVFAEETSEMNISPVVNLWRWE